MANKQKKKKTQVYDDSWMYILLLITLVILVESLKTYTFDIGTTSITYSIVLLPLVYFLSNYITKKYNYQKTIVAISASAVSMVLFYLIMSLILGKNIDLIIISSQFCGYVISQFINLSIYYFLLQNTTCPFVLVFLTHVFSLLTFYMFYTLIGLATISISSYWVGYFVTIGIQVIICILLTFIDSFIKRGIEKE